MNIKQLRCIVAVIDEGLSISRAARTLNTSQPGISTQIQRLESELGFEVFTRTTNRLTGVTAMGKSVIDHARQAVAEIDAIRRMTKQLSIGGDLVIAASHAQARYILPSVIRTFSDRYPDVSVSILHVNREQLGDMLHSGKADLGIMSDVEHLAASLMVIPCKRCPRVILVPAGHPMSRLKRVGLADVAASTIVVYEHSFTTDHVISVLKQNGLKPRQLLKATNSDAMKAYVEQGLGIAVLPDFVFDEARDSGIRAIPADHLFQPSTTFVLFDRKHYLRPFVTDFVRMFSTDVQIPA